MGDIGTLWQLGVVNPLAQALIYLFTLLSGIGLPSWGLTIILFTLAVKVVMIPFTIQSLRSSKAMQEIQPALREIQKKYGKDREKLAQEQMKLYKEHGINPAMGCLPMLIQMPVWIGLYGALLTLNNPASPLHVSMGGFLWIANLALPEGPPYILAILTGITQWVVQKMMQPVNQDPQQAQMNRMMQFMPLMFIVFAFQVGAGLVLYWVTSNVFSMIQQYFVTGWGSMATMLPSRIAGSANGGAEVSAVKVRAGNPVPNGNGGQLVTSNDKADGAAGRAQSQVPKRRRSRRR